jgi:hypothetical protein
VLLHRSRKAGLSLTGHYTFLREGTGVFMRISSLPISSATARTMASKALLLAA